MWLLLTWSSYSLSFSSPYLYIMKASSTYLNQSFGRLLMFLSLLFQSLPLTDLLYLVIVVIPPMLHDLIWSLASPQCLHESSLMRITFSHWALHLSSPVKSLMVVLGLSLSMVLNFCQLSPGIFELTFPHVPISLHLLAWLLWSSLQMMALHVAKERAGDLSVPTFFASLSFSWIPKCLGIQVELIYCICQGFQRLYSLPHQFATRARFQKCFDCGLSVRPNRNLFVRHRPVHQVFCTIWLPELLLEKPWQDPSAILL